MTRHVHRPSAVLRTRLFAAALAVLVTTVGGCQTTQQQARRESVQRWKTVRAQVKVKLASDQLATGNVTDAAGALADAYRLDPNLPELAPLQGRVYLARGDTYGAQRCLENARSTAANSAEVNYLLGIVWQHRQRWDEALTCFLQASQQAPDDVSYFTAVVQAFLQLGKTDAALEWLQSEKERFDWTGAYQAAAAEVYEQLNQWNAAATAWAKVIGNSDADAGLRERHAMALYRAGRLEEALPALARACSQTDAPENADGGVPPDHLKLALADCLMEDGRAEAARGAITEVLQHNEHNGPAWRLLARTLCAERQYDRALLAVRRAVEIDNNDSAALELAAGLAQRLGRRDLAVALATQLQQRDSTSTNPVAQLILTGAGQAVPRPPELDGQ